MAGNTHKLLAAGTTIAVSEPIMLMAHQGGLGMLIGAGLGLIAYHAAGDIVTATGRGQTLPAERAPKEKHELSVTSRLFVGKSVREAQAGNGELVLSQPAETSRRSLRASATSSFFTFSDVLRRGFVPSLDTIYLATLDDGTDVVVSSTQLCHVALAGATRGGKGHIKRSLMAQLAYAGAEIYLLDPKYTRYDRESVDPTGRPCPEDWTPFDHFLQNDPTELIPVRKKYQVIGEYLLAANTELDRRLERYGNSRPVGRPIFLFLDELPDIVDNIPDVQSVLKRILRLGAGVGMNVVCLSQDFLVKTLFPQSGGGAVRDCYRTVLYVGGDATTANVLLDMPARDVPENELGKGHVMLRCDVVRPAAKARSPYVDNDAIYALLGPSSYAPESEKEAYQDAPYLISPQTRIPEQRISDPVTDPQTPAAVTRIVTRVSGGVVWQRQRERERRLRESPVRSQEEKPGAEIEISLQEAYHLWTSGNDNVRDLAKALNTTTYQASKLYAAMVKAQMIEPKKKVVVRD